MGFQLSALLPHSKKVLGFFTDTLKNIVNSKRTRPHSTKVAEFFVFLTIKSESAVEYLIVFKWADHNREACVGKKKAVRERNI